MRASEVDNTDRNSCCHHELSMIRKKNGEISFPLYWVEDYFADLFDTFDIEYREDNGYASVSEENVTRDTLYYEKVDSYNASVWYEQLKDFTFASELLPVTRDTLADVLKTIKYPRFIKLDDVSAKDTGHSCIFSSSDEAIKIFTQSERINNSMNRPRVTNPQRYLFSREPEINISTDQEYRCFVFQSRLTAVSGIEPLNVKDKSRIEKFVGEIIQKMPYRDATLDVWITNDKLKLIEVNNFGADSPAGAGEFNWREDYFVLHGFEQKITWRFIKIR